MAKYRTAIASATAAIDWTNLRASGQILENGPRAVVIRTDVASRIAVGVADPVASGTAGVATLPGVAVTVMLGAGAAAQNIWVMTPASQAKVYVEVDVISADVTAVFA